MKKNLQKQTPKNFPKDFFGKNYQQLLLKIQKQIKETQSNIVKNVAKQKVLMAWKIEKIIDEHLFANQDPEVTSSKFSYKINAQEFVQIVAKKLKQEILRQALDNNLAQNAQI